MLNRKVQNVNIETSIYMSRTRVMNMLPIRYQTKHLIRQLSYFLFLASVLIVTAAPGGGGGGRRGSGSDGSNSNSFSTDDAEYGFDSSDGDNFTVDHVWFWVILGVLFFLTPTVIAFIKEFRPRPQPQQQLVNWVVILKGGGKYDQAINRLTQASNFSTSDGCKSFLQRLVQLVNSADIVDGFVRIGSLSTQATKQAQALWEQQMSDGEIKKWVMNVSPSPEAEMSQHSHPVESFEFADKQDFLNDFESFDSPSKAFWEEEMKDGEFQQLVTDMQDLPPQTATETPIEETYCLVGVVLTSEDLSILKREGEYHARQLLPRLPQMCHDTSLMYYYFGPNVTGVSLEEAQRLFNQVRANTHIA